MSSALTICESDSLPVPCHSDTVHATRVEGVFSGASTPSSGVSGLPASIGINTTDPPPLGADAPPSYEEATSTTV